MAFTYLDQNALIELGVKARDSGFRKKVDSSLEIGSLTVVVSSWHLIETANTRNLDRAVELAEFIDSLRPAWLLERRDIQRLEIEDDFYRFLRLDFQSMPRVTTRSAVFAALRGREDAPRFDIASRDFVKQWIEHPEQVKVLEEGLRTTAQALIRLRELVKAGKVTQELRNRVNEVLVKVSLPKTTPAGLDMGRDVKIDMSRR